MSTVGYATLPVIPSLKGMEREINKQLGGLTGVANRVGSQSGRGFIGNFGSNLVSGLDSIGGTITKWASRGFVAVGATAGAVVAAGLWGGLQRALDREDAIVTFRRMGLNDRNITQLTDSIDAALRGTPITNPEGFALAGRFLAQGFDQADIPGIVSTIADMAAVGNRSFGEMSDVLVAAAGQGRITAAELNRLGDIPLGRVAEQLGMTETELRDLVSTGALTAETFLDAFAAIEEFNGAAKDPTTRVAFANLKTAVAALGEQFLSPLLGDGGVAQRALLALRENVSGLGPAVAGLGQSFANWLIPAVGNLANWVTGSLIPALQTGWEWFQRHRDTIGRLASAVGPAVVVIGALATGVHLVTKALRILGLSTPVGIIMALVAGLVYAWQNSETFRTVVTRAFDAVHRAIDTVRGAVERVVGWFSGSGGLEGAMGSVRGVLADLQPRFDSIVAAFRQMGDTLAPVVQWIGDRLPGAFSALWAVAGPIVRFLVTLIGDTLKMAIDGVVQVFQGAVNVIGGILEVFAGLFTGDWSRMWDGVKQIASGIFNAIVGLVKTWLAVSVFKVIGGALKAITGLFTKGWSAIRSVFSNAGSNIVSTVRGWSDTVRLHIWQAMDRVRTAISGAWQTIRTIFQGGTQFVRQIVQAAFNLVRTSISNAMTTARTTVSNVMTGIRTSVSNGISQVVQFFTGLPRRIISAIPNPLNMLRGSGQAIIRGLIGGITSMAGRVKDAISDVLAGARRLLPFSPAKEGPFSGKGWTLYAGRSIAEGLADGIDQRAGLVARATAEMAARARDEADLQLSALATAGVVPPVRVQSPGYETAGVHGQQRGGLTVVANGTDPAAVIREAEARDWTHRRSMGI